MDTYLILATLGLLIATIFWLLQARRWKREATKQAKAAIQLALKLKHARTDAYGEGWNDAERLTIGRLYTAAVKADRAGMDILAALRTAAPGVEADVQVLNEA